MQAWVNLSDKFAALSSREKIIILLCGLVGIFFIFQTLLIEPELKRKTDKAQEIETEISLKRQMDIKVSALERELEADPDKEVDKKLLLLLDENEEVAKRLSEFVKDLTSPSDMANLLETVLDNSAELKLESLQSLPVEPVWNSNNGKPEYYIHPVKLELTGKYFDIHAYLLALESMEVKYFWRSFRYQVDEYPKARLELVVYTIGTKEEFIGG